MLKIVDTELEDVFELVGSMRGAENFHIVVDGVTDENMEDANGDPMYWDETGETWFEQALLGYGAFASKLTDSIVVDIRTRHYKEAIDALGIKNLVAYYKVPSLGTTGQVLLKDYCFCTDEYLDKFRTNLTYIAKNENSKLCNGFGLK